MVSSINQQTTVNEQINAFKGLVDQVNAIPGVKIDLKAAIDRQRDSLAFAVDELYCQFKDSNWEGAVARLGQDVSSRPNPYDATRRLVEVITHLFESRVLSLKAGDTLTPQQKMNLDAIYRLYVTAVEAVVKHSSKDQPLYFAGIPEDLLPEWYREWLYVR